MWTGLGAGALSALGSIGSGLFGASAQEDANGANWDIALMNNFFNSREAQRTRDWQEEMSNTAYQRSKADLLASGYNPMLAVTNGAASNPAGATAHSSGNPTIQAVNPMSGLSEMGSAYNTALNAVKTFNDVELNNARKGAIESTQRLAEIQERMNMNEEQVQQFDSMARREAMTGIRSREIDTMINTYGENGRTEFNDLVKMYREQIRVGKYMPSLNAVGVTVGIGKDAVSAYQGFKGKPAPVVNKTTNFYQ